MLVIEVLHRDARSTGLTEERLQAARIYTASMREANYACLYVQVSVGCTSDF